MLPVGLRLGLWRDARLYCLQKHADDFAPHGARNGLGTGNRIDLQEVLRKFAN
jgi:hypothetical protein